VWRRRIPVQLLEIAWAAALFLLLMQLGRSDPKPGMIFAIAMAGYSVQRLIFHSLREQTNPSRNLKERGVLSIAIVLLAGYLVWLSG